MLKIFTESADVFQLKDIEKIAPKRGIISQAVKDVVTQLTADGLVDTEKIGTSTYYWSFPGKLNLAKKAKLAELHAKVKDMSAKQKSLKEQLNDFEASDADKENKAELMEKLVTLRSKRDKLKGEIAKYADCDPELLETMKEDIDNGKDAIVRWTDNVFSIRSWIKEKTNFTESEVNKNFGIPDDFDYPE